MSLVDEFYKRYDELASKYEKYTEVFKIKVQNDLQK